MCGIQASGKSTFCRDRLFETHVRISLDLLRTRHREHALLETCLETRMRFVVDNTNSTREDRGRYVAPALAHGYRVVAYWFDVRPDVALERNERRPGRASVPVAGLLGTYSRLEIPRISEGFSAVYRVSEEAACGWRVDQLEPSE